MQVIFFTLIVHALKYSNTSVKQLLFVYDMFSLEVFEVFDLENLELAAKYHPSLLLSSFKRLDSSGSTIWITASRM